MADLGILPKNWRDTAVICSQHESIEFKKLESGVYFDDDCPMQPRVIIVDKNREVFRLTDPAMIQLVLCSLKAPDDLKRLYSKENLPEKEKLIFPPSLN